VSAHTAPPPPRPVTVPGCLLPLTQERRWVGWKWEQRKNKNGDIKWTKPPLQLTGSHAHNDKPETWNTLAPILEQYPCNVGLQLGDMPEFAALDLDRVLRAGTALPWAAALIERARSYAEKTPSGCGVRILGTVPSDFPATHRKWRHPDGGEFEVYAATTTGRYITVTGLRIGDTPDELADLSELVRGLIALGDGAANGAGHGSAESERPGNGAGRGSAESERLGELWDGLPQDLRDLIAHGRTGDRSADFQSATNGLFNRGVDIDDAEAFFAAHPNGPAEKYIGRLRAELERSWDKAAETSGARRQRANGRAEADGAPDAADDPIPLFQPTPPAEPFPVEALGSILGPAAAAIARKVQVSPALAAQSVLAVAVLACQAHADVRLPFGQTRPLSLFFVTVAASGDRKSTADHEALWPIRRFERTLREAHENEHRAWKVAHAGWAAEKKKIEADRKTDLTARRQALAGLGPEPESPIHPFLTAGSPTIEGLLKVWANAPAALGVFSAEGGQFVGGHGMTEEAKLRTAGAFSELWDGTAAQRIRAGEDLLVLYGRRLSVHLMVQPGAAAQFLSDPVLRDQGLLSRVLAAQPESIAGTRFYRDPTAEDEAAVRAYGARILAILEAPWPLAEGRRNELEPRVLDIAPEAARAWIAFHDHVEGQLLSGGELRSIQDFACKAAEQAARIAGILTVVDDIRAGSIGATAMRRAISLVDWFVGETLRLHHGARASDPALKVAEELLTWMQARGGGTIDFRDIISDGPRSMPRTKAGAESALATLAAHGWVEEVSRRPRRVRAVKGAGT
jgi:hypothetical protein